MQRRSMNVRFWRQSGHHAEPSKCPLMTQSGHSTRCLAPEPRPLTTPLSSEIASGLSRVFMLPPPHGEQQQREGIRQRFAIYSHPLCEIYSSSLFVQKNVI